MIKTQEAFIKKSMQLPLKHVAVIMDGNRRYAKLSGISNLEGHKLGVGNLKRIVRHVGKLGLEYLTVYAFSSENWSRNKIEVEYLFDLFAKALNEEFDELCQMNVKLKFIGELNKLPKNLFNLMTEKMNLSVNNTGLKLQVAVNYGSRMEIVQAIKRLVHDCEQKLIKIDDINEVKLDQYLFTANIPDPDLMIRTGGQMRLSNYLLYQSAYCELYVTQKYWPEFDECDFDNAIEEYLLRKRNFGGD